VLILGGVIIVRLRIKKEETPLDSQPRYQRGPAILQLNRALHQPRQAAALHSSSILITDAARCDEKRLAVAQSFSAKLAADHLALSDVGGGAARRGTGEVLRAACLGRWSAQSRKMAGPRRQRGRRSNDVSSFFMRGLMMITLPSMNTE
jgi:hypothetical protein